MQLAGFISSNASAGSLRDFLFLRVVFSFFSNFFVQLFFIIFVLSFFSCFFFFLSFFLSFFFQSSERTPKLET